MQFVLDGDVYKVARVTGPAHNFLGVRLGIPLKEIEVVQLGRMGDERHQVNKDSVVTQVEQGLLEANHELEKTYTISGIFFVVSDSPSDVDYKYLTKELIKRIDGGGDFLITS